MLYTTSVTHLIMKSWQIQELINSNHSSLTSIDIDYAKLEIE